MTGSDARDVRTRSTGTLEAFVLRARRVRGHSVAGDVEALAALINPKWHIEVFPASGTSTVTRNLPPEEAIESLAARVRPLILQKDPVHHGKVLNALGFLLNNNAEATAAREYVGWLRERWGTIDASSDGARAYTVQRGRVDGTGEPSVISDTSLAFAWFYGDVVHADADRRKTAAEFGVANRYEAAVHVVARVAWLTLATLNFIEQLRAAGHLDLAEWVFEEPVIVDVTEFTEESRVYIAPAGAELPSSVHDPFSEEWKPLVEMTGPTAWGGEVGKVRASDD